MTKREKLLWEAEGKMVDAEIALRRGNIRGAARHLEDAAALLQSIPEEPDDQI